MNPTPTPPTFAPNTVDQTVANGGAIWKGQPGGTWTLQSLDPNATGNPGNNLPGKENINPATGQRYDVNPATGVPDDNYWASIGSKIAAQSPGGGAAGSTGAGGAMPGAMGAPTFDLVAATNAAFNTPEIQAANKAISDRQAALAKASADINDNPFYSEATRVGKQAKLTEAANNDIKVQQDLLTSLRADAQIKLNAQKGQYDINNEAYKTSLNNFNNILSSGGLDNASSQDIANYSIQTGIPTSMIQSMIKASTAKNTPKPQIIQATDNSGNLSILAVDANGKILNQTTIAGAGKAATYKGQLIGKTGVSGEGSGTGTLKTADQIARVAAVVADYLHNEDAQNHASPEDLYKDLLLHYPGASSYLSKYWTPDIIRSMST